MAKMWWVNWGPQVVGGPGVVGDWMVGKGVVGGEVVGERCGGVDGA